MSNWCRFCAIILLIVFSILSISQSIEIKGEGQGFSLTNKVKIDTNLSAFRIKSSLSNYSHIKGFFVMSLLALMSFKKKRYLYSGAFTLGLTLITEILQAWSPTRHARLTDALPNFLGYLLAIMFYFFISFLIKNYTHTKVVT